MESKDSVLSDNLSLYVYYKVPAQEKAKCLLAVKRLNWAIQLRYPQLLIKQQKRPLAGELNEETWMEIYSGVAPAQLEGLLAELSALAEVYDLPRARKNELFINLYS